MSLAVAGAILAVVHAQLSLGFGVSAVHTATWGNMLGGNEGFDDHCTVAGVGRPDWQSSITVLAVNYVGDGLRDAFDVKVEVRHQTPADPQA